MKIRGKLKRLSQNNISFEIPYNVGLELGKDYTLDIKPYKSNRSLEQNSLLWGLIQQISDETGNDPMDIYISALIEANVEYEDLWAIPKTENTLKAAFRAVKPICSTIGQNNVKYIKFRCWIGSSKFDTAEMTTLIDYVVSVAETLNIYLHY